CGREGGCRGQEGRGRQGQDADCASHRCAPPVSRMDEVCKDTTLPLRFAEPRARSTPWPLICLGGSGHERRGVPARACGCERTAEGCPYRRAERAVASLGSSRVRLGAL